MRFIETSVFTRRILELLSDDEFRKNERDDLTPEQIRILRQIVEEEYP